MSRGVSFDNNQGPVTVKNEQLIARSTVIGKLIEIIALSDPDSISLKRDPIGVECKIKFNDLNDFHWLISEFVSSSQVIEESMKELNSSIINGSTKLKRQMKLFYLQSLSKFSICTNPFDMDKLKMKSDNIVQDVIDQAKEMVSKSSDLKDGYFDEDINFGIALIVSYSIIECIVLENPHDHA
ncbi:hypothetical protein LMH73_001655 [Vibrio splendidus]|uniref:hypothetical protein n=1 Tax=Vibrio splendidus TaxID=29497 RepID=UPI000C8533B5|nr:hypothetical protein [Vibrio splendidus]MCC4881592.1 hypothetical protein [Vibrio splendidus]PMO24549.1 hypothetical protein BCT15_05885 [Vibrio splendidus]